MLSFGSGFKVQGSRGGFAAFLEEGILVLQPSPLGNAIKLRKLLAAQRLASPFGELPRWGAKNVLPLNLIAFLS